MKEFEGNVESVLFIPNKIFGKLKLSPLCSADGVRVVFVVFILLM